MAAVISVAVEGMTDEAVVSRLIEEIGAQPGYVYGKTGKPNLKAKINGYNNAANHAPWLVLVDLDQDEICAPPLVAKWVPAPAPFLCFRVAVRAVEAWLMADSETLARFLRISRSKVPRDPDALPNPKQEMVNLARRSTVTSIRDDMVPRPGGGRPVGPGYSSRIIEFASQHWRPSEARKTSDSLQRALTCLQRLAAPNAIRF